MHIIIRWKGTNLIALIHTFLISYYQFSLLVCQNLFILIFLIFLIIRLNTHPSTFVNMHYILLLLVEVNMSHVTMYLDFFGSNEEKSIYL